MEPTTADPQSGPKIEVIEPGSPDDPLRRWATDASATPSNNGGGQVPAQTQPSEGAKPDQTPPPETPITASTPPGAAPAETPSGEEDLTEIEGKLDEYVQSILTEERRTAQSAFDRRAATLEKQIAELNTANQRLSQELRDMSLRDLTPEEQERARRAFQQEDRQKELEAYQAQLEETHRDLVVQSLLLEFGEFGVGEGELTAFETPEEMEAFCLEKKADFYEAQLRDARSGKPAEQTPAQPGPNPPPAKAPPTPNVPAGAQAPSDVGGGGVAPTGPQFNQTADPKAMLDNLKATKWETVRVQ